MFCCCCGSCNVKPNTAKWLYFVGFTITAIVTWILRDYSIHIFKHIRGLNSCLNLANTSAKVFSAGSCVGKGAVLRISFGNFLFFGAHAVALLGVKREDQPRKLMHTSLWPLQALAWLVLIFVCFFMPNSVFSAYGQIAKVAGGIFLVLIILIIVDWVYLINEWLLERNDRAATVGLVGGSALCYLGGIIAVGFLYHSFAPAASCALNISWITVTLILAIVYTAISVSPWRSPSAGLLTSGVVFVYSVYLAWAALSSEPANKCSAVSSTKALQIVGFFVAIATVLAATIDAGMQSHAFLKGDVERLEEGGADSGTASEQLPYRPDWFHAMFMLASAYLAMVFTGWELQDGPNPWTLDKGWFSSWVKIVSQWVCAALYTWSLVAATVLQRWRRF